MNTVIIHGFTEGEILARERVEIHSTGKLYGNLITPIIAINEGGIFEGHCKMEKTLDKEDDFYLLFHKVGHPLIG